MEEINLVWADWTVQGEGAYAGCRALFVRLPFCNLECPFCDTEFNRFDKWTKNQFIELVSKEKSRIAVITGGEPTMHKHMPIVFSWLKESKFTICCESNGVFDPIVQFDWLTVSPKRFQKEPYYIHPKAYEMAHEFKYVVDSEFDFEILNRHKDSNKRLSLSPEWNEFDANMSKILNYVKENPRWRISLQTHKFMKVP